MSNLAIKLAAIRGAPPRLTRAGVKALRDGLKIPKGISFNPETKSLLEAAQMYMPTPITTQAHYDQFTELKRLADGLGARARVATPLDLGAFGQGTRPADHKELAREVLSGAASYTGDTVKKLRDSMPAEIRAMVDDRPAYSVLINSKKKPVR
jgi:hypothetical protein